MYDEVVVEILQASEQLKDDALHLEKDRQKERLTQVRNKESVSEFVCVCENRSTHSRYVYDQIV